MPDSAIVGSSVQRLYLEQSRGRTVTRTDWAHALHAETCPICQDNVEGWNDLERQLAAAEAARATLAAGILRVLRYLHSARRSHGRDPLSIAAVEVQLRRIRAAAYLVWKRGSRS
jgi:hypothetical protein